MSFNSKDLAARLEVVDEGGEGAWLFVVGCAPASVKCPNTQPDQIDKIYREVPIDAHVNPNPKDDDYILDLLMLKVALVEKLAEVEGLEAKLAAEDQKYFSEAEAHARKNGIVELMVRRKSLLD